jgi:hypothetical protein
MYYIHPISPHDSAEHADYFFEGKKFGVWEHDKPAPTPFCYEVFFSTKEEAEQVLAAFLDSQKQE